MFYFLCPVRTRCSALKIPNEWPGCLPGPFLIVELELWFYHPTLYHCQGLCLSYIPFSFSLYCHPCSLSATIGELENASTGKPVPNIGITSVCFLSLWVVQILHFPGRSPISESIDWCVLTRFSSYFQEHCFATS